MNLEREIQGCDHKRVLTRANRVIARAWGPISKGCAVQTRLLRETLRICGIPIERDLVVSSVS